MYSERRIKGEKKRKRQMKREEKASQRREEKELHCKRIRRNERKEGGR